MIYAKREREVVVVIKGCSRRGIPEQQYCVEIKGGRKYKKRKKPATVVKVNAEEVSPQICGRNSNPNRLDVKEPAIHSKNVRAVGGKLEGYCEQTNSKGRYRGDRNSKDCGDKDREIYTKREREVVVETEGCSKREILEQQYYVETKGGRECKKRRNPTTEDEANAEGESPQICGKNSSESREEATLREENQEGYACEYRERRHIVGVARDQGSKGGGEITRASTKQRAPGRQRKDECTRKEGSLRSRGGEGDDTPEVQQREERATEAVKNQKPTNPGETVAPRRGRKEKDGVVGVPKSCGEELPTNPNGRDKEPRRLKSAQNPGPRPQNNKKSTWPLQRPPTAKAWEPKMVI